MLIRRIFASSLTCFGIAIELCEYSHPLTYNLTAISFFLPCMFDILHMHKLKSENRKYKEQDLHSVNSCRLHSLSWTIQKSGYRFHEVKSFNHSKNKYYFVLSEGRGETFSGETPLPLFRINSVFLFLFWTFKKVFYFTSFHPAVYSRICSNSSAINPKSI